MATASVASDVALPLIISTNCILSTGEKKCTPMNLVASREASAKPLIGSVDVLEPKIDDWRAMVDSVMIDPAYDGATFNVALADVPEKKTDFVGGRYELPAPKGETTVAIKITDMLGEEVMVTKRV